MLRSLVGSEMCIRDSGSVKEVVKLEDSAPLEGGAVDGASEVEAEQDGTAEEPKPLTGADLDWDNV